MIRITPQPMTFAEFIDNKYRRSYDDVRLTYGSLAHVPDELAVNSMMQARDAAREAARTKLASQEVKAYAEYRRELELIRLYRILFMLIIAFIVPALVILVS